MIRTQVSATTAPEVFDPLTPVPMAQFALARHAFEVTPDGLFHYTDGNVRAVVPPEGWSDYGALYPAAAEAIDAHRAAVAAAAAENQS